MSLKTVSKDKIKCDFMSISIPNTVPEWELVMVIVENKDCDMKIDKKEEKK